MNQKSGIFKICDNWDSSRGVHAVLAVSHAEWENALLGGRHCSKQCRIYTIMTMKSVLDIVKYLRRKQSKLPCLGTAGLNIDTSWESIPNHGYTEKEINTCCSFWQCFLPTVTMEWERPDTRSHKEASGERTLRFLFLCLSLMLWESRGNLFFWKPRVMSADFELFPQRWWVVSWSFSLYSSGPVQWDSTTGWGSKCGYSVLLEAVLF